MTHREAASRAMLELGITQAQIQESFKHADTSYVKEWGQASLETEINRPIQLEQGQSESDYVNQVKAHILVASLMKKRNPDFINERLAEVRKEIKRRETQN